MTDIAAWLLEQIAEDEADAKESLPGPWRVTVRPVGVADGRWVITSRHDPKCVAELLDYGADRRMAYHIARHNPARVLAECDAKRRIFETLRDEGGDRLFDDIFRLLALPYADREGYREEWRPA